MLTGRTELTTRMLTFGRRHLRHALDEYARHYNGRRSITMWAVWIAGKAAITAAALLIAGNLIVWPLVGLRAVGRALHKGYNAGKERQWPEPAVHPITRV